MMGVTETYTKLQRVARSIRFANTQNASILTKSITGEIPQSSDNVETIQSFRQLSVELNKKRSKES